MMSRRGGALILAVWVLVFLAVINAGLYRLTWSRLDLARRVEQQLMTQTQAQDQAVAAQFFLLTREEKNFDTLYALRMIAEDMAVGNASWRVRLRDEARLLNINQAAPEELERLPGATADIVKAIVESPRRPFRAIEELTLVEGISAAMVAEWAEFLTVFGSGVNINTAAPAVLALLGIDDELIAAILRYRTGRDGIPGTDDDGVFESAQTVTARLREQTMLYAAQQQQLFAMLNRKKMTVHSEYYTVELWPDDAAARDHGRPSIAVTVQGQSIVQWR